MLANFKKFGVAAAVAAALGASGAAHAINIGEPGDALLIPFVYGNTTTQVNTMIGVTVIGTTQSNVSEFDTISGVSKKYCSGAGGNTDKAALHWYFFSIDSIHLADGKIPASCEDFVRIDWNFLISQNYPSVQNVPGYLVIADNAKYTSGDVADSGVILYGSTYYVQGNWMSEAFIPVIPLYDPKADTVGDEVTYDGIIVSDVNPVRAGMDLASASGETARFSLRYFVPTTSEISGNTRFVLWFPDNEVSGGSRYNQDIVVYDADETGRSTRTSIPYELNILSVSPTAKTDSLITGVITDGLVNTNTDNAGITAIGPAVNTGFVVFDVNDFEGTTGSARGGVAFSLVGVGTDANTVQLQTDLAHERGVK